MVCSSARTAIGATGAASTTRVATEGILEDMRATTVMAPTAAMDMVRKLRTLSRICRHISLSKPLLTDSRRPVCRLHLCRRGCLRCRQGFRRATVAREARHRLLSMEEGMEGEEEGMAGDTEVGGVGMAAVEGVIREDAEAGEGGTRFIMLCSVRVSGRMCKIVASLASAMRGVRSCPLVS